MESIATLKGLKCPHCESENITVKGTKGSTGTAVATSLAFGAIGAIVAGKNAAKNVETAPLEYKCNACGQKFETLPLEAPENEILETPCTVTFTREKSMVGAAVPQILYINGVKLGAIKNGESITFQVNNRYNDMFVTDQYGVAFGSEFRFEAAAGGSVNALFNRKFTNTSVLGEGVTSEAAGAQRSFQPAMQAAAPAKSKGKFLHVLGIIMQALGYLFLLAMLNVFITDGSGTDWTGAGFGVVAFIGLIIGGTVLTKKNS